MQPIEETTVVYAPPRLKQPGFESPCDSLPPAIICYHPRIHICYLRRCCGCRRRSLKYKPLPANVINVSGQRRPCMHTEINIFVVF